MLWKINWRLYYDLCDEIAISLRSERIATDLCAIESTDGDLGDHGNQLETNQQSISVLEDLCALHGAVTDRRRSPPSGMGVVEASFVIKIPFYKTDIVVIFHVLFVQLPGLYHLLLIANVFIHTENIVFNCSMHNYLLITIGMSFNNK